MASRSAVPAVPPIESNRAAADERRRRAKENIDWAMKHAEPGQLGVALLERVLQEGLSQGVEDAVLERGLVRVCELEENERAAVVAEQEKRAIAAMPVNERLFREGSLVKLQGLSKGVGSGAFEVALAKYNGRMGRVVEDPPAWLMKASGGSTDRGLVAVLLDSRSTDRDRSRGVWVAVPPAHLKFQ